MKAKKTEQEKPSLAMPISQTMQLGSSLCLLLPFCSLARVFRRKLRALPCPPLWGMPGGSPAPAVLLGCGFSQFRQNTSETKGGLEVEVSAEKSNMSNQFTAVCRRWGPVYLP